MDETAAKEFGRKLDALMEEFGVILFVGTAFEFEEPKRMHGFATFKDGAWSEDEGYWLKGDGTNHHTVIKTVPKPPRFYEERVAIFTTGAGNAWFDKAVRGQPDAE